MPWGLPLKQCRLHRIVLQKRPHSNTRVPHRYSIRPNNRIARHIQRGVANNDKISGGDLNTNVQTAVGIVPEVPSVCGRGTREVRGGVGGGGAGADVADYVAAGANEGTASEEHRAGGGGDLNTDELLRYHIRGARNRVVVGREGCAIVDEARHGEENARVGIGNHVPRHSNRGRGANVGHFHRDRAARNSVVGNRNGSPGAGGDDANGGVAREPGGGEDSKR